MRKALQVITNTAPESDREVLARCRAGQTEAFEVLLRRHQHRLFSVALRMMKDRDLAAELVQEALYRAYKNLPSYSATGSVKGWLTRITVNVCLNEIRKRQRLVFSERSLENWLESDRSSDPAHRAQASELGQKVKKEVGKLTPLRQALLAMAALAYSYDEMAEVCGQSVSQVKSELFRARKKLRESLKEYRRE